MRNRVRKWYRRGARRAKSLLKRGVATLVQTCPPYAQSMVRGLGSVGHTASTGYPGGFHIPGKACKKGVSTPKHVHTLRKTAKGTVGARATRSAARLYTGKTTLRRTLLAAGALCCAIGCIAFAVYNKRCTPSLGHERLVLLCVSKVCASHLGMPHERGGGREAFAGQRRHRELRRWADASLVNVDCKGREELHPQFGASSKSRHGQARRICDNVHANESLRIPSVLRRRAKAYAYKGEREGEAKRPGPYSEGGAASSGGQAWVHVRHGQWQAPKRGPRLELGQVGTRDLGTRRRVVGLRTRKLGTQRLTRQRAKTLLNSSTWKSITRMRGSKQAFGTKMGFGEPDVGEGGDAGATSPRLRKHTCVGSEESEGAWTLLAAQPSQAELGGRIAKEKGVINQRGKICILWKSGMRK